MTTIEKASHTPGPWHTEPRQWDHGASIVVCSDDATQEPNILAVIPPMNEEDEPDGDSAIRGPHDEANARLIAAAPEMLEALEELADLMEQVRIGAYKPDTFTCQLARKAIAKAKGEL